MIPLEIMSHIHTDAIEQLLTKATQEIDIKEELRKLLRSEQTLRVKFGIDPTAEHIHLGHSVPLFKLKEFQDLGHHIVLLIGDFTAMIGDPSGKSVTRPALTHEQVKKNMEAYTEQAGKILDMEKTEVRYNSEWYGNMSMKDFYELARNESALELMTRSMVKERQDNDATLTLSEFTYPLLQAYDSYQLKADVEVGGIDQIFNMRHGRGLQEKFDQKPQQVVAVKLLIGLDGKDKMSKSLGNHIGITEGAQSQFGKIMSLPDDLIFDYTELVTPLSQHEIDSMRSLSPRDAKMRLASEVVAIYHGKKEAEKAQEYFENVFSQGKLPEDIEEISGEGASIIDFLVAWQGISKSEAKRLIEQKGVTINEELVEDWSQTLTSGDIIKVGSRKFAKIV